MSHAVTLLLPEFDEQCQRDKADTLQSRKGSGFRVPFLMRVAWLSLSFGEEISGYAKESSVCNIKCIHGG
jgi:hypothetical protein